MSRRRPGAGPVRAWSATASSAASCSTACGTAGRPSRSPAGWPATRLLTSISHESIYRFIYAQIRRTNDGSWRHYLPRAKAKRGWRGRKGESPASFIQGRVSIAERPEAANDRAFPGHWEADLMLFKTYGQAILVAHERVSRSSSSPDSQTKPPYPPLANSSPGSSPCHPSCARPSPSTTAPSSPSTTASKPTSVSKPSSAIPTAPAKGRDRERHRTHATATAAQD